MVDVVALSLPDNSLIKQAGTLSMPQQVLQAIKSASARTGVDFSYMLKKASQESNLDANARSGNSSATGLYQFTKQTWLQMMKSHGAAYGLGNYADHISIDAHGRAQVADPTWRQAILNLRKDPQVSAEMSGELDKANLTTLKNNVDGKIGPTELYLAHFLGSGGASNFLNIMHEDPNAKAAEVLPKAAAANPSVFYDTNGAPRSLTQIYQHFAQKFDKSSADIRMASATPAVAAPSIAAPQPSSYALPQEAVSSYAVAVNAVKAAPVISTNSGGYVPLAGSPTGPSSLFATMLLAQADAKGTALISALDTVKYNDHHKKDDGAAAASFV